MSELDDLAVDATASPVALPPSMAELRKRVRRRTRNTVTSVLAAGLVIAGATVGIAAASSSGSSSRSIVATPGPDDAVATTVVPAAVAHLVPSAAGTVSHLLVRADGGGEMIFGQNGCDFSLRYGPLSGPAENIGAPITVRGAPGQVPGIGNISWYADGTGYGLSIEAQDAKPLMEQCDPSPVAESLVPVDAAAWDAFVKSLGDRVTVRPPANSLPSAPDTAGAPTTTTTASTPDFEGEKAAVAQMVTHWGTRLDVDASVAVIEDGEALRSTIAAVNATAQVQAAIDPNILIRSIELVGDDHAIVTFDIRQGNNVTLGNQTGGAVKIEGSWRLSRDTYCRIALNVQVACPAS